MSLTIELNPTKYNLSKSPVMCEISTDDMYTDLVPGTKALGAYTFSVGVAIGNFIEIITTTTTLHLDFISYTNPPTVGKLRTRDPSDSFNDYWDKIESDLLLNSYISTNYTVTQDGLGKFDLEAINTGKQYSLENCVFNGTGINFFNYFYGTDDIVPVIKPNYEIHAEVFCQDVKNGSYSSIFTVKKQPYTTGKVRFNLEKIIDSCLDYYFPTPNQSAANLCDQVAKEFYIKIYEYFGSPPTMQTVVINPSLEMEVDGVSTKPGYILKAGFSPINNKYQPSQQLSAYYWSYPLYLSTRSYERKIKKGQPDYLFFCLPADVPAEDLELKYITKYKDDTADLIQYSTSYTGACTKGSVICFPVNPSGGIIDVLLNSLNSNIREVQVTIVSATDTATDISPAMVYTLDFELLGENRIFLYTNSAGGADVFVTKGEYEKNVQFERETTGRIYETSDAWHLGSETSQNLKQDLMTASSGWLTKDELEELEDLFLAKYKVEVTSVTSYKPITITSTKYKKHKTNQNLFGVDIEYYYQLKSPVTDHLTAAL